MSLYLLKEWLNSRTRTAPTTTIVIHATGGSSLCGALQTLIARNLSYHYMIDKEGVIIKCAPLSRVAFHAGKSIGPCGESVNRYSIGISLINRNDGIDPYTEAQKEALEELLVPLLKYDKNIRYLTTHRQISWPRKTDPVQSELFLKKIALKYHLLFWQRKGVPYEK